LKDKDMTRELLRRRGWLVALGAGLAWLINDVATRISPDSDAWDCNSSWDYGTNALDPLMFFLSSAAVVAVYERQKHRSGRLGRYGAIAAFAGLVGAGFNNPLEHCGGIEALGFLLWVPSNLLMLIGSIVLGFATLIARVHKLWVGPAIAAGTIGLFAGYDSGGMIIFGMAWLCISIGLWMIRDVVATQE
jgi:hypothetical protein